MWQGRQCIYEAALSIDSAHIYDLKGKRFISVALNELELQSSNVTLESATNLPNECSPEEWALAKLRFNAINFYEDLPADQRSIRSLSEQLSLSEKRCYVLLEMFDVDLGPKSLLRNKRGRKVGSTFTDTKVEGLLQEIIDSEWKGPGVRATKVKLILDEKCRAAGYKSLSYSTIKSRIEMRKAYDMEVRRIGKKQHRTFTKLDPAATFRISHLPNGRWIIASLTA